MTNALTPPIAYAFTQNGVFSSIDGVNFVVSYVEGIGRQFANTTTLTGPFVVVSENTVIVGNSTVFNTLNSTSWSGSAPADLVNPNFTGNVSINGFVFATANRPDPAPYYYNVLYDGTGAVTMEFGGSNDRANYYSQDAHYWYNSNGSIGYLSMGPGYFIVNGSLTFSSGNANIGGNLNVSGSANIGGNLNVSGSATYLTGNVSISGYRFASVENYSGFYYNTIWDANNSAVIQLGGYNDRTSYYIQNNHVFQNTSVTYLAMNGSSLQVRIGTTSTSTTTGALQVTGGISTQDNIYVGGLVFTNDIYSNGYRCRTGVSGSYTGHQFNWNWDGSHNYSWIDTTNLGYITTTSDYRLKKDVKEAPNPLDEIRQWRIITYTGKEYGELFLSDEERRWSWLAHELQEISPDCVQGEKDGVDRLQSLNLVPIVARLARGIQELEARLAILEGKK